MNILQKIAAFAKGLLTVIDVERYSPKYSNKPLVEQIKALRTLENGELDSTIPNDCTDALQYGVMTVLRNPFSLTFPERKERYDNDYSIEVRIEKLRSDNPHGQI